MCVHQIFPGWSRTYMQVCLYEYMVLLFLLRFDLVHQLNVNRWIDGHQFTKDFMIDIDTIDKKNLWPIIVTMCVCSKSMSGVNIHVHSQVHVHVYFQVPVHIMYTKCKCT
jgi:hypothetical protein